MTEKAQRPPEPIPADELADKDPNEESPARTSSDESSPYTEGWPKGMDVPNHRAKRMDHYSVVPLLDAELLRVEKREAVYEAVRLRSYLEVVRTLALSGVGTSRVVERIDRALDSSLGSVPTKQAKEDWGEAYGTKAVGFRARSPR